MSKILNWLLGPSRRIGEHNDHEERGRVESVIKKADEIILSKKSHTERAVKDNPIASRIRARPLLYADDLDRSISSIVKGVQD